MEDGCWKSLLKDSRDISCFRRQCRATVERALKRMVSNNTPSDGRRQSSFILVMACVIHPYECALQHPRQREVQQCSRWLGHILAQAGKQQPRSSNDSKLTFALHDGCLVISTRVDQFRPWLADMSSGKRTSVHCSYFSASYHGATDARRS